ncbi:calcium-binding protein, partial [Tropicimonas aquimaris]
ILIGSSWTTDRVDGAFIYLSDGEGVWTRSYLDVGVPVSNLNGLAIDDVNGDGLTDLVATTWVGGPYPGGGFAVFTAEDPWDGRIVGNDGDNKLRGGKGDDLIRSGAGDDHVLAKQGDDEVHAGDGDDLVNGQDGNDHLYGDEGNDIINGNDGDDIVYGGAGSDVLHGNGGNDLGRGGVGNDRLSAGTGDDTFFGQDGDDALSFDGAGEDIMVGGAGDDAFIWSQSSDGGDASIDVIVGDEHLRLRLITDDGLEIDEMAYDTSQGFDTANFHVVDLATASALAAEILAEYDGQTTAQLDTIGVTIAEIDLIRIYVDGYAGLFAELGSFDFSA